MRGPLLLHSLAEFRELIFECFDVVHPGSLVEVGAEDGTFTVELLRWARDHEATVHAVEPFPTPAISELVASWPELHLVEEHSPAALEKLEPADVYLVDGDHNYVTVRAELQAIFGGEGDRPCLAFLHDVGWPSGRRDMYYDP
ncbi:MAG: class I SAM-dependent methyltransferase, partial [Actinobacteria bacterium]|nr:class I SAM-dependent methyltransferase [Actinomycetota bacterium]